MTVASSEVSAVVKAAKTLTAPLPTGPFDDKLADQFFWARFDALGRAIDRLRPVEPPKKRKATKQQTAANPKALR